MKDTGGVFIFSPAVMRWSHNTLAGVSQGAVLEHAESLCASVCVLVRASLRVSILQWNHVLKALHFEIKHE